MTKTLILCADDFGQNSSICDGILHLAAHHRINAISCLVNMPGFYDAASELAQSPATCLVGLHLNLTFGQALSALWREKEGDHFTGLPRLMMKAYARRLDEDVVLAELKAQLTAFVDTMNCYPDFIDGHQHIHQLPIIRHALIRLYEQEKLACFVRHTFSSIWHTTGAPKTQAIALLGGRALMSLIKKHKMPTHTTFEGVYSFSRAKRYRAYMRTFLKHSHDQGLIMCHPGHASHDKEDPLHFSRVLEFDYLMSDAFLTDLADNSCVLQFF